MVQINPRFVGVSDLELCLANGQWVEHKEINLYPYDAGTDSGASYTAADQPTLPNEAIRRIKPNNPNDPRSPFYDQDNKEMKPLAKLHLTRQRLYEKSCDNNNNNNDDDESDHEEDGEDVRSGSNNNNNRDEDRYEQQQSCETTSFSLWTECSNQCGAGFQMRMYERKPFFLIYLN